MKELAPSFDPEGIMHGPHAPTDVATEVTLDMRRADKEASSVARDTKEAVGRLVLQGIMNGNEESLGDARMELRGATYQNEMNRAMANRAFDEDHITSEQVQPARVATHRANDAAAATYIAKVQTAASVAEAGKQEAA